MPDFHSGIFGLWQCFAWFIYWFLRTHRVFPPCASNTSQLSKGTYRHHVVAWLGNRVDFQQPWFKPWNTQISSVTEHVSRCYRGCCGRQLQQDEGWPVWAEGWSCGLHRVLEQQSCLSDSPSLLFFWGKTLFLPSRLCCLMIAFVSVRSWLSTSDSEFTFHIQWLGPVIEKEHSQNSLFTILVVLFCVPSP